MSNRWIRRRERRTVMQDTAFERALADPLPARRVAPGQCPDDMQIARFVAGTLEDAARQRAIEHLAYCDPCLERVRVVVKLERDGEYAVAAHTVDAVPVPDAASIASRRLSGSPRRLPVAALVASIAVVATGVMLLSGDMGIGGADAVHYRESRSADAGIAAPALVFPRDGARLSRSQLRFEWAPLDAAVSYQVELLGANGDILWLSRGERMSAEPPQTLFLEPGVTFYAWVRAQLADGKTVKSQAISFSILEGT